MTQMDLDISGIHSDFRLALRFNPRVTLFLAFSPKWLPLRGVHKRHATSFSLISSPVGQAPEGPTGTSKPAVPMRFQTAGNRDYNNRDTQVDPVYTLRSWRSEDFAGQRQQLSSDSCYCFPVLSQRTISSINQSRFSCPVV